MSSEYVLTYQDYLDAQRLFFRHRKAARLRLMLWLYGLPALALATLAGDLYIRFKSPPDSYDPLLSPTFFLLFLSVWVVGLRPWHLRRYYKKLLPPGQKKVIPAQFSFDEQGIVSAIPGRSEGRFFWPAILDYAENDKIALLFIRKKNFLFVPKRAMDEDSWQSLRAYVQQHRIGNNSAH